MDEKDFSRVADRAIQALVSLLNTYHVSWAFQARQKYKSKREKLRAVQVGLVAVTQPLPREEGMAEDHGAPEAEQFPRAWTRGRKEIESRQRASVRVPDRVKSFRQINSREDRPRARLDLLNPSEVD